MNFLTFLFISFVWNTSAQSRLTPFGCQEPREVTREVHATYLDNGTLMCAVEVESYSWWDLIEEPVWTYDEEFWFPCPPGIQRKDTVSGKLLWWHTVSCHRCNPGRHHLCSGSFQPQ